MQFTRVAGPPNVFTETFEHCTTESCQLIVTNGNADGSHRLSSASITLNGVQVAGPSDFNQQVAQLVIPVEIAEQNELTVWLASNPGGFLTIEIQCSTGGVDLSAGGPGASLLDATTLASAVNIVNGGEVDAEDVVLTAITLSNGMLTSPSLPFALGTIPEEGSAILYANFTGAFMPLGSYPLVLEGTYTAEGATHCFTLNTVLQLPPAAPGSAVLATVDVPPLFVTDAPFPPQPPVSEEEANKPLWAVPFGPFVAGDPTEFDTGAMPAPLPGGPLALGGLPVVFEANTGGINGGMVANTSTTAEPSGGSNANGVVFVTGNWFAAYSTNGGANFTPLNPTAVFPNDTVGYCCDQIVQYVPSINRVIWLLQGTTTATKLGGYRLASASPAAIMSSGGTAWTYWNLTPAVFGQPTGTGFDYPDMSVGNNYLYVSWDAGFGCPSGCSSGFQVVRIPLSQIQASTTINIGYTNPSNATMCWGSHIMQNTLDEIFWAGHNNNSQMRVFSCAENSNSYFWRDRGVSSWPNNAPTSIVPDGKDWLGKNFSGTGGGGAFPRNSPIGAARSGNELWFAWTAGTNSTFGQAHVQMVTFDRNNNFNKIRQVQIWNNDYAFAYPALSTNACTGEIGLSLEYGGNGNYQNHVVGFWGDFVVFVTTSSTVGTTRFGDYVTIRQEPPTEDDPGNLFSAFGYGLNPNTDVHYVVFGRPDSTCIPPPPAGDINFDGVFDVLDLLTVHAAWGPAEPGAPEDIDNDGFVGVNDLLMLLRN